MLPNFRFHFKVLALCSSWFYSSITNIPLFYILFLRLFSASIFLFYISPHHVFGFLSLLIFSPNLFTSFTNLLVFFSIILLISYRVSRKDYALEFIVQNLYLVFDLFLIIYYFQDHVEMHKIPQNTSHS